MGGPGASPVAFVIGRDRISFSHAYGGRRAIPAASIPDASNEGGAAGISLILRVAAPPAAGSRRASAMGARARARPSPPPSPPAPLPEGEGRRQPEQPATWVTLLTGDMGNTFLVLFRAVAAVVGPVDPVGNAQRCPAVHRLEAWVCEGPARARDARGSARSRSPRRAARGSRAALLAMTFVERIVPPWRRPAEAQSENTGRSGRGKGARRQNRPRGRGRKSARASRGSKCAGRDLLRGAASGFLGDDARARFRAGAL